MNKGKNTVFLKVKLTNFFYLIIITFFSCSSETIHLDKSGWGLDFFPLDRNSFRIYNVSIIDYSVTGEVDSIKYYLKEVVTDSFLNLNNEYSYLLTRYKRYNEADWKIDSIWSITKNDERLLVVENNLPIIKMVFPVKENKQWDANKMNVGNEEKYTMYNVWKDFKVGENSYSKTISILQMDNPDTILIRDKRWEVYAQGIGLIYKEKIQLKYCSEISCIGEGKINSGIKYKQELIEYGKE